MTLVYMYNPPASYIYVCVCVMKNGQECASVERHAHRRDDERNVVQRLFKLTAVINGGKRDRCRKLRM